MYYVSGTSPHKSDQAITQVKKRPSFAIRNHECGPLVTTSLDGHGPTSGFRWKIKSRPLSNGQILKTRPSSVQRANGPPLLQHSTGPGFLENRLELSTVSSGLFYEFNDQFQERSGYYSDLEISTKLKLRRRAASAPVYQEGRIIVIKLKKWCIQN